MGAEDRTTRKVADEIEVPVDLVPAEIELVGTDGNAGSIMGKITGALKRADNPTWMIDLFRREAMAGDYDHLLRVAMVYNGDLD